MIHEKLRNGEPVAIGFIGDSCGCGFGANPMLETWNGNHHGYLNGSAWGYNWQSGNPHSINTSGIVSQSVQDSKQIPSAARLLRTWIEEKNPASKLYNYSASGWTSSSHVSSGTVAALAAKSLKPDIVIIALGINNAKNNQSQTALNTLISQCLSQGMQPVISLGHYPAVDVRAGANTYCHPQYWTPMPYWNTARAEMIAYATSNEIDCIDPTDGYDISYLYDEFHPSKKGHATLFHAYRKYLSSPVMIAGHRFNHSKDGAVKVGDTRLKLGGNGPVRINTPDGVFSIYQT